MLTDISSLYSGIFNTKRSESLVSTVNTLVYFVASVLVWSAAGFLVEGWLARILVGCLSGVFFLITGVALGYFSKRRLKTIGRDTKSDIFCWLGILIGFAVWLYGGGLAYIWNYGLELQYWVMYVGIAIALVGFMSWVCVLVLPKSSNKAVKTGSNKPSGKHSRATPRIDSNTTKEPDSVTDSLSSSVKKL